jgi:hypothetical protein
MNRMAIPDKAGETRDKIQPDRTIKQHKSDMPPGIKECIEFRTPSSGMIVDGDFIYFKVIGKA